MNNDMLVRASKYADEINKQPRQWAAIIDRTEWQIVVTSGNRDINGRQQSATVTYVFRRDGSECKYVHA